MKKRLTNEEEFREKQHQARRRSIKEGMFATAQFSLGNNYISPFAIAINASNSVVALFGSIGGLLGPLSQLLSSRLMERHSRKKIVLKAVLLESLMWIPFLIIGLLFYKGIVLNLLPIFLLISFAIQLSIANVAGPAWFSWVGDIVDEEFRGRWFAKRNLLLGTVSVILAITSSFVLDYFKQQNWTMFGFMILFFIAMCGRLMSWHSFKKQYEPKLKLEKGYYFSFWDFLKNSRKTNFGKFAIFRSFLAFSQSIAGTLVVIYLLRNLEFSYVTYMIITMTGHVFSLFSMELWGKFADRYGNYRTIIFSAFLIPAIPILWILNPSPIYLIFVPLVGNIAWAGFNLSSGNFIYDNVRPEKRGLVVSYYNMLTGIGTFLGAGLGALLIKYINTTIITPIAIIFILSAVLRTITIIIGLPHIKEVRKTKRFSGRSAFKNIVLKGTLPTIS